MHNVGINLLWLIPGQVGGSEEYTLRLLRAVHLLDPDDVWIRIYAQQSLVDAHPDIAQRFEVEIGPQRLGSKVGRIAAEHTWLARRIVRDDLFHQPGSVLPAGCPVKSVFTVHDLQPLEMPQNFGRVKRNWLGHMLPRSVDEADRIVCPSHFTANRVIELLEKPAEFVTVVPHGHQPMEPGIVDPEMSQKMTELFGQFVLYPSIAYPHKRHVDLIEAVAQAREKLPELQLVLTGSPGPAAEQVSDAIKRLSLEGVVHQLGRVPEAELDALYRIAQAVVIPSIYEGFGNPALEAMIRGVPVIVADAGALPEVVGKAGLVVPPENPAAIASAIVELIDSATLRHERIEAGLVRAEAYGWGAAGGALLNAYRAVLT